MGSPETPSAAHADPVLIVPAGQVVCGIQLPVQAKSTGFAQAWEVNAGVEDLVSVARHADALGFFYIGVCDHIAIPRESVEAMSSTWYDTIATLGLLAGVTTQSRLLSHVWIVPYRHPLQSVNSFATLDHLSKGRVIVGVGAGHLMKEFQGLGLDFSARGRQLDEALPVILRGLTCEYVGDMAISPRPVQRPRPPIWVGGSSEPALRRAAKWADGWLPQGTTRTDLPKVVRSLLEHRRNFRAGDAIDVGAVTEFMYVGRPSWELAHGDVAGTAEEVAESLRAFITAGANHLQVRFRARSRQELEDQMAAFADGVVPLLGPVRPASFP